jgi:hypothetical protein
MAPSSSSSNIRAQFRFLAGKAKSLSLTLALELFPWLFNGKRLSLNGFLFPRIVSNSIAISGYSRRAWMLPMPQDPLCLRLPLLRRFRCALVRDLVSASTGILYVVQ